ncbi:MAG: hypothetical protein WBG51_10315, partial [Syntrophobacteria bacterium]
RDYAPRDKLGTGGTGRTGSPCDVPFRYGNQSRGTAGRLPGGTPIFFTLAALRSVPHRTASGIFDKRVPSFVVSRQQFMKYAG